MFEYSQAAQIFRSSPNIPKQPIGFNIHTSLSASLFSLMVTTFLFTDCGLLVQVWYIESDEAICCCCPPRL